MRSSLILGCWEDKRNFSVNLLIDGSFNLLVFVVNSIDFVDFDLPGKRKKIETLDFCLWFYLVGGKVWLVVGISGDGGN